jgi:hypothetical protein
MPGSWNQKRWDRFGSKPPRLRTEAFWLMASKPGGRRAVLLFDCTLGFALQLRERTETLSQGSRVLLDNRCVDWPPFRGSLDWPVELHTSVNRGWLQAALGRHRCLKNWQTKEFSASAKFESKLSANALMWSAKNGIPKPSWTFLFLTYQGASLEMRRHLDYNTPSLQTWLRSVNMQMGMHGPS